MSRKGTFSKALTHLKSTSIDEKIEMLNERPTNSTTGYMTGTPSETNPAYQGSDRGQQSALDTKAGDFTVGETPADFDEAKDTTGLFEEDGTIRVAEPPGDTSYILGPMAAMYYTWSNPNWTRIGYIRQADRKMVNLGTLYGTSLFSGKFHDWDGNEKDANGTSQFVSYGQLTLEQARWFKDIPKANNDSLNPDDYTYRAYYPGPPAATPDAWGRYPCVLTGADKEAPLSGIGEPPVLPGTGREATPDEDFSAMAHRAMGHGLSRRRAGEMSEEELEDFVAQQDSLQADIDKYSEQQKDYEKQARDIAVGFAADVALTLFGGTILKGALKGIGAAVKGARAISKSRKVSQVASAIRKTSNVSRSAATARATQTVNRADRIRRASEAANKAEKLAKANKVNQANIFSRGRIDRSTPWVQRGASKAKSQKTIGQLAKDNIKGVDAQMRTYGGKVNPLDPTRAVRGMPGYSKAKSIVNPRIRNINTARVAKGRPRLTADQINPGGFQTGPDEASRRLIQTIGKAFTTVKNNPARTGVYGGIGAGLIKSGIDTQKAFNNLLNDGGKDGLSTIGKIDSMISPNKNVDISELETSVKSIEKELGKQAGDDVRQIVTTTPKEIQSNLSKIKNLNPKRSDFSDTKSYNEALKLANIISGKYSPAGIKVAGKVYLNYIAGTLPKVIDNNYLGQPYVNRLWTDMDLTSDGKVTSGDAVVGSGQKPVVDGDELVAGFNYDFNTNQEEIASDPQKFIEAGPLAMFAGLAAGLGNPYALDSHPLPPAGILTWAAKKTGIGGDHRPGEIRIKISDLKLRNRSFYNQLIRNGTIKESSNIGYKINSRVLNNLHERVVLPEGKKKSYKVRPGQKYKTKINSSTISKPVKTPNEFRSNIGAPDTWGKDEYDLNVRNSQEKKNELLDRLHQGEYAFNYAVNGGTGMKSSEEMDSYWKKNPDLYSYYHSGKKYKLVRKEQVDKDYLLFLVDETGMKTNILQSELNEKIAEEEEKDALAQYMKENPSTEPISYEKDPMVTKSGPLVKDVAKRLKNLVDYEGKPSPKGYPDKEVPKLVKGWHPEYAKNKSGYYKKLDPVSAKAMPMQDDPEIDAEIVKARKRKKIDVKTKTEQYSNWRQEEKRKN